MQNFADRLTAAIIAKRTPLIVGLDPRLDQLPVEIKTKIDCQDLNSIASGFELFCLEVLDVVAPHVAAVKPQWAFFEQLGSTGIESLERIISAAHAAGLIVIADAKRGDIGTTAEAYAEAFFRDQNGQPFCDAVTVQPYMGMDTLQPFLSLAAARSAGLFVLVKTSNPGSGDFQDLFVEPNLRLFERVAGNIQQTASAHLGKSGYGHIGAVVGATYPDQLAELRERMPNVYILVPGFGAQGASAADTSGAFDANGLGAIVNSSRAILFAFEKPQYRPASPGQWQRSIEQACLDSIAQLRDQTPAKKL